ncbi:MAG: hypothetical protein ACK4RK_01015 [Gemmataceae bacterium]
MRYRQPVVIPCVVVSVAIALLGAATGHAQDRDPGIQPGNVIPNSFHSFNINGERAGRHHCLVCANGLNPVVMIFARQIPEPEQPLAHLLTKLEEAAHQYRDEELGVFIVFLLDTEKGKEREDLIAKLADWAKGLKLEKVIVSFFPAAGPKDFALPQEAEVLILPYHKFVIAANFTFTKDQAMSSEDVDAVLSTIPKILPPRKQVVK